MVACSGTNDAGSPVAVCTMPPTIKHPADVPRDFPWPEGMSLTRAHVSKKFVSLEGHTQRTVDDLFESLQPLVVQSGFDIINTDYEGFEAEIYFARSNSLAGIVSLREAPCDGYVRLTVIYDPLETPAGREAVKKTRDLSGES